MRELFPSESQKGILGSIDLTMFVGCVFAVPYRLRDSNVFAKGIFYVYSACIIAIFVLFYTYYEILDFIAVRNNLNQLTRNACLSVTHTGGILKFLNIIYFGRDINDVIDHLKQITKEFVITKKQKDTFRKSERMNKIVFAAYFSMVAITGLSGLIMAIIKPDMVGTSFPYRTALPGFLSQGMNIAFCGASVLICGLQIVAIDYLNINLINQISCHLQILNHRLEDLGAEQTASNFNPNDILHNCIRHHQHIVGLRYRIETIFKLPILTQFVISVFIFALTGFQASIKADDSDAMVLIYFYCGCIFSQLFFYCWFANEVLEQSKSLSIAGYSTVWYTFDQAYRKRLLIFLINAQRPIFFTGGGFFSLTLNTFSTILTRSYTYVALLRQVYSN